MQLHDTVELTHDLDRWPAGTAAVVVDERDSALMIEIVGPDGRTLALLDVDPADVRPIDEQVHYAAA
jgi:hypothetical protein